MRKINIDVELVIIGLLCVLVVASILGLGFWAAHDQQRVDEINNQFTTRCTAQNGHAVIDDKDLCIKNGKIIFHE